MRGDLHHVTASHAAASLPSAGPGLLGRGAFKREAGRQAISLQEGSEGGRPRRPTLPILGRKRLRPCGETSCQNDASEKRTPKPPLSVSHATAHTALADHEGRALPPVRALAQPLGSLKSGYDGTTRLRSITPPPSSGFAPPCDSLASTRLEKAVLGGLLWCSECRFVCVCVCVCGRGLMTHTHWRIMCVDCVLFTLGKRIMVMDWRCAAYLSADLLMNPGTCATGVERGV